MKTKLVLKMAGLIGVLALIDRLLLLADDRSAFLPLGAGSTDWVCGVDRRVCHLVDHFIYPAHTIASITSCTECSANQAD